MTSHQPIFILGMRQRSGTNFLYNLLCLHPDVVPSRGPSREMDFLGGAGGAARYVEGVKASWGPMAPGPVAAEEAASLRRALGAGIAGWLCSNTEGKRVVTKFPSVAHLDRFFELFPDAPLLVLVRDGRSVVESAVRSWGATYAREIRKWADAAHTVLEFERAERERGLQRHLLVRYERVLAHPDEELTRMFEFCGVDPSRYDFAAARAMPLMASSTHLGDRDVFHFEPVERPADFEGATRWATWTPARHREFNLVAGELMEALGYEPVDAGRAGAFVRARSRLDDAWFSVTARHAVGPFLKRVALSPPLGRVVGYLAKRRRLGALSA